MRGGDVRTGELFSYVDLEARVRKDHPPRAIRQIVNKALVFSKQDFAALYAPIGRPSTEPFADGSARTFPGLLTLLAPWRPAARGRIFC